MFNSIYSSNTNASNITRVGTLEKPDTGFFMFIFYFFQMR